MKRITQPLRRLAVLAIAGLIFSGCSRWQPAPIVTIDKPIKVQSILVVPKFSLLPCSPLGELDGTKSGVVTDWVIKAHGIHNNCMTRQQLIVKLLQTAASEKALIKIHQTPQEQ